MPTDTTTIKVHRPALKRLKMLALKADMTVLDFVDYLIDQAEKREMKDSMKYESSMNSIDYAALEQQYGTVKHEGKEYWLAAQPDYSNSVFTGWWGDAEEGEDYISDFRAPAYDSDGDKYDIHWQFREIKGEEVPLDDRHRHWLDATYIRPQ